MKEINFVVYGNPVPKGAAQAIFNPLTKQMHKKTPKRSREWMQQIRLKAQEHVPEKLFDCPLKLTAIFFLQRPKSRPKKYGFPDKRPDMDNLTKALLDGMTGIIFTDDSRIVDMNLKKRYGDPPRIEIHVSERG